MSSRTQHCSVCEVQTAFWTGVDNSNTLNYIRWFIFSRISTVPRHGLILPIVDLSLERFEVLFCSFGGAEAEEVLVSDSDDDEEPLCTKKRVWLRSFGQVQAFASFHELQHTAGPVAGACQAAKVHKSTGEVSVLVPPLRAEWCRTSKGFCNAKTYYCFAVVNCEAAVSPLLRL